MENYIYCSEKTLHNTLLGALHNCRDEHGEIKPELYGSVLKRFIGTLRGNTVKEYKAADFVKDFV